MGSVGDAYDNAMAESFFASLECELLNRRSLETKIEAPLAVFTWIGGWYNPRRHHSARDYLSPMAFEEKHAGSNPQRVGPGFPTGGRPALDRQAVTCPRNGGKSNEPSMGSLFLSFPAAW